MFSEVDWGCEELVDFSILACAHSQDRAFPLDRSLADDFLLGRVCAHLGLHLASGEIQFVTGTARLDMFPKSRFPFDLHYALSDSRVDSGLPSTLDFRSHSFGISQRFRPIGNSYSLSSSFNRREQEGAGFRDTQNLLISDFTTAWKHNDLSLGLSQSRAKRQLTGEQTMFRSIVARHSYSPGSELSLNTTLTCSSGRRSSCMAFMANTRRSASVSGG